MSPLNPLSGGFIILMISGYRILSEPFSASVDHRAFLVAQMVKNLPAMQETRILSPGQEDPLEKGMTIHPSILVWKIPWTEELGQL